MSAHSFSPYPPIGAPGAAIGRLRGQFTPLFLIAAAHALALYGIYSGQLHRVVQHAIPAAVMVRLLDAPPPPEPVPLPTVQELAPPELSVPDTVILIAPAQPVASVAGSAAAAPAAVAPGPAGVSAAAGAGAAPAAAPAAAAATPRTISSGVEYLKAPQPEYPAASRRVGEQGRVVLRVLVNDQGQAEQVQVQTSSGSARLDEAGRQAVLRAVFKPYLEDGRPVPIYVIVPLNFKLGG